MDSDFVGSSCKDLFVHVETLNCCTESHCIPCLYKIFPFGQSEINSDTPFPPNQRPELCPRAKLAKPNDSKYIGLYSNENRILTVGDGDFSFSLSLQNKSRLPGNMICTSYESFSSVIETYPQASETLTVLNSKWKVPTFHEIDASNLPEHDCLREEKFDVIVWNFPCIGVRSAAGLDGQVSELDENKALLRNFFSTAVALLKADGLREIHVTHKTFEPFSWWNIDRIAKESGLVHLGCVVFDRCLYPGYINRKALDKKSFPASDARTFVFQASSRDNSIQESSDVDTSDPAFSAVDERYSCSDFRKSTLNSHPHLRRVRNTDTWNLLVSFVRSLQTENGHHPRKGVKRKHE